MEQTPVRLRKPIISGLAAFRAALLPIVIFEILYKTVTALAVKPLLSFLMQLLLRISGDELAFNDNIWRFALTIPGVIAIILLSCIAVLLIYFEFAVVIELARQAHEKETVNIKAAIIHGVWSIGSLKSPTTLLFILYALVLLPVVNMGVTSSLLPQLTIPNFITSELGKTFVGKWSLLALAVIIFFVFCCLIFTLPAMVLEHCRFGTAVKRSISTLRAYRFKMLGVLLVFIAVWMVLFLVPRRILDFFFGSTSVSLGEAIAYYGFSLQTPVMLLIWLATILLQLVLMPLLLTLLTSCFLQLTTSLKQPDAVKAAKIQKWLDRITGWLQVILGSIGRFLRAVYNKLMARPFIKKHKRGLAILLTVVLLWAVVRAFMVTTGIHGPIVIGHRGSAYAVENTLEAIQHAIDAGADYTEVDILLSADGVPMVIHDTNLQRLSGQNKNVYDLTAEELKGITLSQNGYSGNISTLEEVVEYCEGKILLAVEYKLHGHEQVDLIEQVMRVMTKSEYQNNSIYVSLNYELISRMKTQYPKYRIGYCVYGNVGQPTADSLREMNIDFLLIEEWMVSRDFVAACRNAWIPVYVWTVNNPERMDDYLRLGVVGLVSDYPDAAMEVIGSMVDLNDRVKPHEAYD